MSAKKLEKLRREFIRTSGKVEKINKEMDEIRTEMRKTAAEKMVELEIFKLLEWEVDYTLWYDKGATLKFQCQKPTTAFNMAIEEILPDPGRNVWEQIQLGSFKLFIFDDSISISIEVKEWNDLPLYLSELKGYGIENLNIKSLRYTLSRNEIRLSQHTDLVEICAEIFIIKPISNNDDNKDGDD